MEFTRVVQEEQEFLDLCESYDVTIWSWSPLSIIWYGGSSSLRISTYHHPIGIRGCQHSQSQVNQQISQFKTDLALSEIPFEITSLISRSQITLHTRKIPLCPVTCPNSQHILCSWWHQPLNICSPATQQPVVWVEGSLRSWARESNYHFVMCAVEDGWEGADMMCWRVYHSTINITIRS